MAVSRIGINFTKFAEIQPPNIDIANTTKQLLTDIPVKANEVTNGYLGYGILFSIFVMCIYTLADKTPSGDFQYDNLNATNLSFAICAIMGLVLVNLNFINSLLAVTMFIFFDMITFLYILYTENR